MRYLSLSVPGYNNIQGPQELQHINNSAGTNGSHIVTFAIQLLFAAAIILSLVMIIVGGINWITSGGDKQKLDKARSRVIYAVIGLVVVLAAFLIVNLVGNLFNVKLI